MIETPGYGLPSIGLPFRQPSSLDPSKVWAGADKTRGWTKPGDCPHVFKTVNDYLITLYDDGELYSEATIRKFRIVQTEGNRQVAKLVDPYRLETILSWGIASAPNGESSSFVGQRAYFRNIRATEKRSYQWIRDLHQWSMKKRKDSKDSPWGFWSIPEGSKPLAGGKRSATSGR